MVELDLLRFHQKVVLSLTYFSSFIYKVLVLIHIFLLFFWDFLIIHFNLFLFLLFFLLCLALLLYWILFFTKPTKHYKYIDQTKRKQTKNMKCYQNIR